jgi:DNA-directed RNA polymerase subunit alpha
LAAEVDIFGFSIFNKANLMKFRNFGKKSLTELDERLLLKI